MHDATEDELVARLAEWGALASGGGAAAQPAAASGVGAITS
jgi:hypothetical protein